MAIKKCEKKLKFFTKNPSSIETVNMFSETFKEFKNFGIDADKLHEISKNFNNSTLKNKIHDSSIVLDEYAKIIKNRFIDPLDELEILYKNLVDTSFFKNFNVLIDEFYSFSSSQIKILKLIMTQSDVSITFKCESEFEVNNLNSWQYCVKKTAMSLYNLAKSLNLSEINIIKLENVKLFKAPEIEILEQNIFENINKNFKIGENILIYSAQNTYDELDFVACNIRKLVVEKNYRYGEIVVITRNVENYERILRNTFKKYDIPYFLDFPELLLHKNLFVFIFSALDCMISNFDSEHVFKFLKSGLSNVNFEEISIIENYCFMWDITGDAWFVEFINSPEGFGFKSGKESLKKLEEINEIRNKIIDPFVRFRKRIYSDNHLPTSLYKFLLDFNVPENIRNFCGKFLCRDQNRAAEEQARLWDIFIDVLDEFSYSLGDQKITLRSFSELLRIAVKSADISFIPQCADEIVVASVQRMRLGTFRAAFVVGAAEDEFPKNLDSTGIFTNFEKQSLIKAGVEISENSEELWAKELFYVYNALTSASEKLFISWSSSDEITKYPSEIVGEIRKIFPQVRLYRRCDFYEEDMLWSEKPTLEFLIKKFAGEKENLENLSKYFENNAQYKIILDAANRACENRDFKFKNPLNARLLFGATPSLSASQIEKFYSCSFDYFCTYGLCIKQRKKNKFDSLEHGLMMHFLLEKILSRYASRLENITEKFLVKETEKIINEFVKLRFGGWFGKSKRFKHMLFKQIIPIKIIVQSMKFFMNSSKFLPVKHELNISERGDISPIEIKLQDGSFTCVEGKVDRIDIVDCGTEKFFRIVDYKTGSKKFSLLEYFYGLSAQMFIYANAISKAASKGPEWLKGAVPAGVFYFPAIKPVINSKTKTGAEANFIKIVRELRMNGVALQHEKIQSMSCEEICNSRDKTNLMDSKELKIMLDYSEYLIKTMAENIKNGEIYASPTITKSHKSCEWCKFGAVCASEKIKLSTVREMTKDEILEKMKRKIEFV